MNLILGVGVLTLGAFALWSWVAVFCLGVVLGILPSLMLHTSFGVTMLCSFGVPLVLLVLCRIYFKLRIVLSLLAVAASVVAVTLIATFPNNLAKFRPLSENLANGAIGLACVIGFWLAVFTLARLFYAVVGLHDHGRPDSEARNVPPFPYICTDAKADEVRKTLSIP